MLSLLWLQRDSRCNLGSLLHWDPLLDCLLKNPAADLRR